MMQKSNDEWQRELTAEQYHVLREQGTEAPFSGALLYHNERGEYRCAACGNLLFTHAQKYDPDTPGLAGWPSFAALANNEAVQLKDDYSLGMHRTEVVCSNCGSHLGHLFEDPTSPTGQHYCINSVALDFKKS